MLYELVFYHTAMGKVLFLYTSGHIGHMKNVLK